MSAKHNYALILAGGSGTRLWPMSRKELPKQFQYLLGDETPFQLMVRMTTQVIPQENVFVMASADFRPLIQEQIPKLPAQNILKEPARRDNGPAIILGIMQICAQDPEAKILTLWSDHLVLDEAAFAKIIKAGFATINNQPDRLVIVGAQPTKPDPTLGHIQFGQKSGESEGVPFYEVQRFVEKPEPELAKTFFESQEYLWNAGYSFIGGQEFIHLLSTHYPEVAELIEKLQAAVQKNNWDKVTEVYDQLPKQAIEPYFTLRVPNIVVIPADMGWSDIGSWATLHAMLVSKSGQHLVTQGEVRSINSENSLVFAKDRLISLVGVKDLIVVDTGDAVLIMHHNAPSSDLKKLVQETLADTNPDLL